MEACIGWGLITHYEEKELNLDSSDPEEHEKAYSTKQGYRIYLENWIRRRWGSLGMPKRRAHDGMGPL